LPSLAVDNPFSRLKPAVQFYGEDLPGYQGIIEAEFQLWQSKWKTVGSKFRPLNAIETLTNCDRNMFPNMYQLLKLVSVLPVSTVTVEGSFSSLRRLKTYLRNSTSESRLVGLALLFIHKHRLDGGDLAVLERAVLSRVILKRMEYIY